MSINEASNIIHIWGIYLEYCSRIVHVFMPSIPESFLPFPKATIHQALNMMINYYLKTGDEKAVSTLRETLSLLPLYIDDTEAISEAAEKFNNDKWREQMIPSLKELQVEWMKNPPR